MSKNRDLDFSKS